MTDPLEAAKLKAEAAYNAAADRFDAAPLAFWERYGRRTVERLQLRVGARVLDVCCGTGASAVPAAQAVGAPGSVIAVDLAEELLKLGRAKAAAAGLSWLEFRRGDMTALAFPAHHFEAVVCVFGVFFVPDMERQVAELWRLVRPGGQLAITTWGPDMFGPGYELWLTAVRRIRPDLYSAFNPWDRITTPQAVQKLFADAGIPGVDVLAEDGYQPLRSPEDFWTIALGSGLRWTIDQMGPEAARAVKQEVLSALATRGIDRVTTNVIYAIARAGLQSRRSR
jgi:ubiquinone/menaquinone biosynthesis C-methylase UbiE